MTVPVTANSFRYPGDGTTGPWEYPVEYTSEDYIEVWLRDPVAGDTLLTPTTNYVRISGGPGKDVGGPAPGGVGSVYQTTVAVAVGQTIAILANTPAAQTVPADRINSFRSQEFEQAFDNLAIQNRAVDDNVARAWTGSPLDPPGQKTVRNLVPGYALTVQDDQTLVGNEVSVGDITNAAGYASAAGASAGAAAGSAQTASEEAQRAEDAADSIDTSAFMQKAANLSDLADAATARGNLDVYSKGAVDTGLAAKPSKSAGETITGRWSYEDQVNIDSVINFTRGDGGAAFINIDAQIPYLTFRFATVNAGQVYPSGPTAPGPQTFMTREKGDARYALIGSTPDLSSYGQFTTSSVDGLSDYPVGQILACSTGSAIGRNQAANVGRSGEQGAFIVFATASLLSGTWRCKGIISAASVTLMQRVA